MKTSTFIALLAVASGFITVTAANFKLKNEYNKGNLKDPYVKTALPSFRFIKDMTDTGTLKQGHFVIRVGEKETPGVSNYYSITTAFLFTVSNDTLFIKLDKSDESRYANWTPIIITTHQLESIDITNGEYEINSENTGNLSIYAKRKSALNARLDKADTLSVFTRMNSAVSISAKGRVSKLNLQLEDKSSFNAQNLFITGERTLQISDKANLQLSGRSIENFGLKSTQ